MWYGNGDAARGSTWGGPGRAEPPVPPGATVTTPSTTDTLPVAVAIPCFNEAAAIQTVIADFRNALPDAEIVVFDNNSQDGTGEIAHLAGARVVPVADQGKGHVVQAIFRILGDRPAVLMVDGDGTYPADAAPRLLDAVLSGRAEMAIGARKPVNEAGAMTPVRWVGNVLIRTAFQIFIGVGPGDMLSGYRVFSPRFLQTVYLRSTGFEIETELTCRAVGLCMRVVEIPHPYYPRIAGTESKLRAFRDGRRILRMIVHQGLRLRPWRAGWLASGAITGIALALRSPWPLLALPLAWVPGVAYLSNRKFR